MYKKICPCCKEEFFAFNNRQIFCSKSCAGKYRRQTAEQRICEFCGKPFLVNKNNPAQKFCSTKCYNAARTKPKEPPPVVRVDKTFDDWVREADECNLDYGNYRALIEIMGKTYEELKATADQRTIALHAHGGAASKKNYRD